jgi:hypothetical protein
MAFVRISLMTPQPGQESRVQELLDDLVRFYQGRDGFITAYRLSADPHAGGPRMGRVSVWENEDAAHKTAMEQHDLAVQSELKMLTQTTGREEYSFTGVQP